MNVRFAFRPLLSNGEGGKAVQGFGELFKCPGLLGGVEDRLERLKLYLLSVNRLYFFLLAASLTTEKQEADLRIVFLECSIILNNYKFLIFSSLLYTGGLKVFGRMTFYV